MCTYVCNVVCTITLNRPSRLNAICMPMPQEIKAAIAHANADEQVHITMCILIYLINPLFN